MNGIFDKFFNNKPGKGVSREQVEAEREKVTFNGFFKVYKRKFWQIMQLNFLSFIFYIPVIAIFVIFISQFIIPWQEPVKDMTGSRGAYTALWNLIDTSTNGMLMSYVNLSDLVTRVFIGIFFTAVPLIAIGPIQAGFTYILQSFIKEKPVFLTHDFFKRAKSNFGQSLAVSLINMILTALLFFVIYFYRIQTAESGSVLWTIALTFMCVIFVVYMLMNLYIYPILVTFNVSLKQLYKNSFFLAMTSFFPGLLVLLIDGLLIYLIYALFLGNIQILIILVVSLVFGTIGLINNYFSFKYIKFYLLDPALASAEEKKKIEYERVFQD